MEEIKLSVKTVCILIVLISVIEYLTGWTRLKKQMKFILNSI